MFGIGATELIIILVLALVIFGPGKLPDVGKAVGRSIREFKKATSLDENDTSSSTAVTDAATPVTARPPVQKGE